ncbi:hypothetical protein CL614_04085 [archaeon]|jgi:hypothetical protein|nr:hypothetical protein [archaeon]
MVFLTESVRNLENESVIFEDGPPLEHISYKIDTTAQDWTNVKNIEFTLTEARTVVVAYLAYVGAGSGLVCGGSVRMLLDSVPVSVSHSYSTSGQVDKVMYMAFKLAAGTYDLDWEASIWRVTGTDAGNRVGVHSIRIGALDYEDATQLSNDSGNVNCADSSDTTVLTESITVPATRTTVMGDIRKYTYTIDVCVEKEDDREVTFTDVDDSDSVWNAKVFLDDVQIDWYDSSDTLHTGTNPTYGKGSSGKIIIPLTAGASHTLKIKIYNGSGADDNGRVYLQAYVNPWFLGNENETDFYSEPVNFSFLQGSTIYLITEDVWGTGRGTIGGSDGYLDVSHTKTIYIGAPRAITSYVESDDYYSVSTGANRLTTSFTLNYYDPASSILRCCGFTGGISIIGVDVR